MLTVKLLTNNSTNPLSELSTNTSQLYGTHTTKRTLFAKKSLNLKLQKSQLEHCRVDIVNRQPQTQKENNQYKQRGSNFQLLKKEVEYLEEDRFSWEKFPKGDLLFQTAQLKPVKKNSQGSPIIQAHSIDQVKAQSNRSVLLEGLVNSFGKNFSIAPLQRRTLTQDERKAKNYFTNNKKRSLKKCGAIEISGFDKQNFRKTIHSKVDLAAPFRKYFSLNRNKRNSSCNAQVIGHRMKKHSLVTF